MPIYILMGPRPSHLLHPPSDGPAPRALSEVYGATEQGVSTCTVLQDVRLPWGAGDCAIVGEVEQGTTACGEPEGGATGAAE